MEVADHLESAILCLPSCGDFLDAPRCEVLIRIYKPALYDMDLAEDAL